METVEALAMATGRKLLGASVPHKLVVWYINLEDPMDEIARRFSAAILHFKIKAEDIAGQLFINSGRETDILVAEGTQKGVTVSDPTVEAVVAQIIEHKIDVLIVDPFVKSHRVPENDNGAIDLVATQFARIADRTNCAVELVHHVRKTGGAEITVEDGRGAVALISACRSARVLNPMSDREADDFGVENLRLYFRVDSGKSNLSPPADKAEWFKMESEGLGNGDDNEMQDYVGVATSWKCPDLFAGVTASDLVIVQKAIDGGQWRESPQASQWVGHPIAKALNLNINNPREKAKVKKLIKTSIASEALVVVEHEDDQRHKRKFVEVGKWAT
jgi:hypothetical protein